MDIFVTSSRSRLHVMLDHHRKSLALDNFLKQYIVLDTWDELDWMHRHGNEAHELEREKGVFLPIWLWDMSARDLWVEDTGGHERGGNWTDAAEDSTDNDVINENLMALSTVVRIPYSWAEFQQDRRAFWNPVLRSPSGKVTNVFAEDTDASTGMDILERGMLSLLILSSPSSTNYNI